MLLPCLRTSYLISSAGTLPAPNPNEKTRVRQDQPDEPDTLGLSCYGMTYTSFAISMKENNHFDQYLEEPLKPAGHLSAAGERIILLSGELDRKKDLDLPIWNIKARGIIAKTAPLKKYNRTARVVALWYVIKTTIS